MTSLIIAVNVLNRMIRNKLLIAVLVVALVIVGLVSSSIAFSMQFSKAGEAARAREAAAMALLSMVFLMGIFGNLVALVTGVNVSRQEIKEGTIFGVLSKPVTRLQYLLGSYFGGLVSLLLTWLVLVSTYLLVIYLSGLHPSKADLLLLLGRITLSVLFFGLAFCLAQRFSAWIAAVLGVAIYEGDSVVGLLAMLLRRMRVPVTDRTERLMAFPFPATNGLDALSGAFIKSQLNAPQVGWVFLHLWDYVVVLILVAWWLFRRQDLCQASE